MQTEIKIIKKNMPVVVISTNLPRAAIPDNFLEDVTDLAIKMLQKPKKVIIEYFILSSCQVKCIQTYVSHTMVQV